MKIVAAIAFPVWLVVFSAILAVAFLFEIIAMMGSEAVNIFREQWFCCKRFFGVK